MQYAKALLRRKRIAVVTPILFVLMGLSLHVGAVELGAHSAVTPVSKTDDWWQARHKAMNERVVQGNVDLLMIGDSITHGWEDGGKSIWDQYYGDRNAVNLGIGGDRTEHVLWRLQNGNIKGISPKLAVIMIGTNNHADNSAQEIADGVTAIVEMLRCELPQMQILLLAIFPREESPEGQWRKKLAEVNALIAKLDDGKMIHFLDIGKAFLEPDGTLPKSIMPDALHPNAEGYAIWAREMEPTLAKLLGDKPKE